MDSQGGKTKKALLLLVLAATLVGGVPVLADVRFHSTAKHM
jgi:hypothetical protein